MEKMGLFFFLSIKELRRSLSKRKLFQVVNGKSPTMNSWKETTNSLYLSFVRKLAQYSYWLFKLLWWDIRLEKNYWDRSILYFHQRHATGRYLRCKLKGFKRERLDISHSTTLREKKNFRHDFMVFCFVNLVCTAYVTETSSFLPFFSVEVFQTILKKKNPRTSKLF